MHIVVLVTAKDRDEAGRIAEHLLTKKLAACVNILDTVHSLFWWKGNLDKSDEALLIIKTKEELFDKLQEAVKSVHSYDVCEIIAIPIIKGNKDYLQWIDQSVSN